MPDQKKDVEVLQYIAQELEEPGLPLIVQDATIMFVAPSIRKFMTKDTVIDGRLANPVIIARPVRFILYEQRMYEETSAKIVRKNDFAIL